MGDLLRYSVDFLAKYFSHRFDDVYGTGDRESNLIISGAQAVAAVNLARLVNAKSILPLALFQCCQLGAELVYGYRREDGTIDQLTTEDLVRCLEGRVALMQENAAIALNLFRGQVSPGCTDPSSCSSALKRQRDDLCKVSNVHVVAGYDAFGRWDEDWIETEKDGRKIFCNSCVLMLKAREEEKQRAVWRKLPFIFNVEVDNWDVISNKVQPLIWSVAAFYFVVCVGRHPFRTDVAILCIELHSINGENVTGMGYMHPLSQVYARVYT